MDIDEGSTVRNSPTRSKEFMISSLFIVAAGIFDIYLLLRFMNILGSS